MRFPGQGFNLWDEARFDPISAAISGGTSLLGGLLSSGAASDAASTQAAAADKAAAAARAQYEQTRTDLAPYRGYGTQAGNDLMARLPSLSSPFNPTMADLEATPGYKFTLDQGQKAVQNAASAKGLGVSGAASKGAADYAAGLASKTYGDMFNIDQTNKNNAFNKLLAVTGVGQNAANQTGGYGATATQNANNFATTGAAATGAGMVGGTNALTSGLTGAANQYGQYAVYTSPTFQNMLNRNNLTK